MGAERETENARRVAASAVEAATIEAEKVAQQSKDRVEQERKKAEIETARIISKAKQDGATTIASAEQDAELAKTNADLKVAEAKLKIENRHKLQGTHQKSLDSITRQTQQAKQALDAATRPTIPDGVATVEQSATIKPNTVEQSDAPAAPASQPAAPQPELSV